MLCRETAADQRVIHPVPTGFFEKDRPTPRNKAPSTRLRRCRRYGPKVGFSSRSGCSIVPSKWRTPMRKIVGRMTGTLLALFLTTGLATEQSKITVAVGG